MSGSSLRCSSCGFENAPGVKFCGECGRRLALSSSGQPDPRAYTPRHLAEKILRARSALEGERKQVTVLFADVKGSMELAEQLDPEEWHLIIDRFFQLLTEGVHRFEGTVNQYTGDGIMALFGAPIAHEDHAQRACWAALHLRDEVRRYADELRTARGVGFAVRMGLNSGEVVVGKIGDDLRMDYTAQGHAVGLAQRMEQLAEPGRPLLTENTAKLVAGFFTLRDLGPSRVKGASEPLRLYELEGPGRLRTRFDVSRTRGLSRFVGRGAEMAALEVALERALGGSWQAVALVAEPGVGKSRLCHEFTERCRARGIGVVEAHAVAHGKNIPLLPWMELMRNTFGITKQDGDDMARQKIAGRLLLLDPGLHDALPVMFDFLGVPDPARPAPRLTPEAMQRELVGIMSRFQRDRARRGELTVFLLEDLHWLDGASEALFAATHELHRETPTLVVLTFRPEYDGLWLEKSSYRQLALQPLGADALAELLRDLLGTDPSVMGLADRICARTGGNPFFIEEVVQALVEAGSLTGSKGAFRLARPVEELAIPSTVQAVLAARIDRLPEREKAVLQTAAVIGRELPEPLLGRVADLPAAELAAAVQSLIAAEFLYEEARYPEVEYAFKHPLTQEVAYRSQLGERRARVHATVARALEELHRDKLDERAALLAYHWERAGQARLAAEWHRRAADWIGARNRSERVYHWRQVRTLLAGVPESPETLALGVLARRNVIYGSYTLGSWEDDAPAVFAEGMALAERLGDASPRVRLLSSYGVARLALGEMDEGMSHLRESLRLAEESGNGFLRLIARLPLVAALHATGPLGEALALSEEAEALGRDAPELDAEVGASPLGLLLAHRTSVLVHLGRFEEAERAARPAMDVARARTDRESLCIVLNALSLLGLMTGDGERALQRARQAVEHAEAVGTALSRTLALGALGRAQLGARRWSDAAETLGAVLALMRERRTVLFMEMITLAMLAEARVGLGDRARARETMSLALEVDRRRRAPVYAIRALVACARVLLALDGAHGAAQVDAMLREAAALVTMTEARAYAPFLHATRARLALFTGDEAVRQRELREAQRLFAEMRAPLRAAHVERDLGL